MIEKNIKNNKGYTLLFAVLVSSVVLSVGISILTISKKEFLLSSGARESISAFYAADSGLECAIMADRESGFNGATPLSPSVSCMGSNVDVLSGQGTNVVGTSTFQVRMQNGSACAIITVSKYQITNNAISPEPIPITSIESRGYNLGWDATLLATNPCSKASVRRVERAIRYTF